LGAKTEINFQDISNLKYCSSIFKEALRLYPPAAASSRQITEIIDIDDFQVPRNTIVWVRGVLI
jgi:cytochrome P450